MAVKKSAVKKPAKRKAPAIARPEFGVEALAKLLGIGGAAARVKLRAAKIKKSGRTYDFGSQAGVEKIAKQLEAASTPAKA